MSNTIKVRSTIRVKSKFRRAGEDMVVIDMEIFPFGEVRKRYRMGKLFIVNTGDGTFSDRYTYELQDKEGNIIAEGEVYHNRDNGFMSLVKVVWNEIEL